LRRPESAITSQMPGRRLSRFDRAPHTFHSPTWVLGCARIVPSPDASDGSRGFALSCDPRLWTKLSDWDLRRDEFIAFCPKCCLDDISHGRTPYGRQLWQQAWCTVCNVHHLPLLLRARHTMQNHWTARQLEHDASVANACGYGYYRGGPREPSVHYYMIYALIEIQKAAAFAVAGIRPRRGQWGNLSCQSFLQVLSEVTSWALTHFEPVRAWSAAEDLTPIERSEGFKLVGRQQRLMAGPYANKQTYRSLVDITDPAVRGSALWLAHALMSRYHEDASDRDTGITAKARQLARLSATAPAGRAWLTARMQDWPQVYRQSRWIDLASLPEDEMPRSAHLC
jgi:hypothetical protein